MLRDETGEAFTTGWLRFADSPGIGREENAKIWLPITFLNPAGVPLTRLSLLDTGADFSVLGKELIEAMSLRPGAGYPITYSTRLGSIQGRLQRLDFMLVTEAGGQSLEANATFFVSDDWSGPTILGYNSALSNMRFALEPQANRLHFGAN